MIKKKVSIPTVRLYKYAIHHVHQCKILQEISLLNSFSVCLFYLIYFPYFHSILVFVQSIWWRFSVSHWVPVLCEFIYRMAFIRNSPTCTYPNIIIIIISIIIIHAQTYLLYIQIDCKCLHIWGVCGVYVRHQSCNFQAICSIYTYMYVWIFYRIHPKVDIFQRLTNIAEEDFVVIRFQVSTEKKKIVQTKNRQFSHRFWVGCNAFVVRFTFFTLVFVIFVIHVVFSVAFSSMYFWCACAG